MEQKYVKKPDLGPGKVMPQEPNLLYYTLGVTAQDHLDTIGQVDQNDPTNQIKAQKRSFYKAVTFSLNGRLLNLDSPLKPRYQSAMNCMNYVFQNGQILWSRLCRQRTCIVCSKIETSKLMRRYGPALENMNDPQFVTLTFGRFPHLQDFSDRSLKSAIYELRNDLKNVMRRSKRKMGHKIDAIGKFECAIDPYNEDAFNPHFHLIVDGEAEAKMIKSEWLREYNFDGNQCISSNAQHIRQADKGSLKELFKYVTKALGKNDFDAFCYDAVQRATVGMRTVFTFGNVRAHDVKESDQEMFTADWLPDQVEVFKWNNKRFDWIDPKRNAMTGFFANDDQKLLIKELKHTNKTDI